MKQRVITGVLAAIFGLTAIGLMFTPVLGILVAIVAGMASFEIQHVAKIQNKVLVYLNVAVAVVMIPALEYRLFDKIPVQTHVIAIAYIIFMLFLMLANYNKTKFEDVVMSIFAGVIMPYAISTVLLLRDLCLSRPDLFQQSHVFFIIFFALLCAWLNDTFAYFVGRKFGKHKLAPKISPKKTIEGALGGIFITMLFNVLIFFIFDYFFFKNDTLKVWMIIPTSILLSTISIGGDLSASVIKRNFGAKDFGTIFPGHGGIMDRFDSYSFVMPTLYAVMSIILNSGV
ncbi:MAG: phosphatidate cytidylyltransferase [Oscillospiraceae bacterium]|nr:phosphatidate cytidylyltransferase [Oscillospiraceae bacterium]